MLDRSRPGRGLASKWQVRTIPSGSRWGAATKVDETTYGIFDVFPGPEGRQAHLDGPIAAALLGRADELLSSPPDIKPIDVLAAKLPG